MSKWEKVKLGSVGQFKSGGTPSRSKNEYFEGNIPWITTVALKKTYIDENDAMAFISAEAIENSATKIIAANSIMVGTRVGIGKVSINKVPMCTSQDIISIENIDEKQLDKQYLVHCIKSYNCFFDTQKRGATIQGISSDVLKSIDIPIPPLKIQREIANTLDTATSVLVMRKQQLADLDKLTQSIFYNMFGDPVINENRWDTGIIKDLAEKIQYGTSEKASVDKLTYPIVRMNNITYQGNMDFSDMKFIDLSESDKKKYLVYKGDLLFNRTNSKELVGKTAVYRQETPMAFAGYLIRLVPNEKANSEFISAYLNSSYGKKLLFKMAKNIVGMANINAQELSNIKIYIPPIALQNQFATIVTKIEEQKALVKQAIDETRYLFDSLMSEYFE
ncbi:restriction endonuclease subunit S [Heliophilum fasciatum]|uniref:Type I restriction enzyme S subunit n=1 Tax=Heliophilum fasciatum TaxID=35700 RepID=A0A4R2RHH8_9FIRM|nr:restriction endonuclease subunit S [Heliophilum fasciatum]MCW2278772.1 type I restriction enzyme S subunit [Heliophilum fasciatum]TCP62443.1 type I restriction enzyme S subunit [Heliophilum fasciatum]